MNNNKEESPNTVESNEIETNDAKGPIISEELKKEASESLNQVKDIIKNVNIKEEAQNTKGVLLTMWKNPVGELTKVVNNNGAYFKIAVILLCIWTAAEFISGVVINIRYFSYFFSSFIDNLLELITQTVSPIISVFALSLIVYLLYRDKVGSLIKVSVIITIASIPRVIAAVISILPSAVSKSSQIISPVNSCLYVLSVVMAYFSLRCLLQEDDESFFKKYILIQAIYIVAKLVFSYINIYI